jgi:hypothetical protein
MRSDCTDAILAERILDAFASGATPSSPEYERHVRACDHCAVARARASRVKDAWQVLEASRDGAAARARFFARTEPTHRIAMTPGAVALAVLLLASVAMAGVRMGLSRRSARLEPAASPVAEMTARAHGAEQGGPWREQPPAVTEAPLVHVAPETAKSVQLHATVVATSEAAREALQPLTEGQTSVRTPGTWSTVAVAMRAGDRGGAERALDDLTGSADAKTRDDARLARAQLWLAQGRLDRARPELEDLSGNASTALVRERARNALETIARRSSGSQ